MHLLPPSLWLLVAFRVSAEPNAPRPTAIRKMPPDAGEKFYHHYYAFAQPQDQQQPFTVPSIASRRSFQEQDARLLSTNASAELDFRPAFAPLDDRWISSADDDDKAYYAWRLLRRAVAALERRQWACPGGTNSCLDIGYPNSCCPTGETCMVIQDTGLGPVGCCPAGSACGGTISSCAAGDTPCGSDIGGGCCISGYACQGVGCVRSSTAIVTPTQSTASSTSTSTTTTTSSPTSTTTTSSSTTTTQPTQTTAASAPVRPTSSSSSPSPSTTTTSPPTSCPTGFYACLATHGGGCCQTGRDCQTTSCPPAQSATVVSADGITVAVPATATTSTGGSCATGWYLCAADAGGGNGRPGCCPSGYGCGTASCSLVAAGATASVAKELPGAAARRGVGAVGVVVGAAAVVWALV